MEKKDSRREASISNFLGTDRRRKSKKDQIVRMYEEALTEPLTTGVRGGKRNFQEGTRLWREMLGAKGKTEKGYKEKLRPETPPGSRSRNGAWSGLPRSHGQKSGPRTGNAPIPTAESDAKVMRR